MEFYFNPKSVTLLFFFLQGFVFSALLLRKGIELDKRSGIWLSFFVFLCAFYISPWMFGYAGWYGLDGYREVLFFVPTQHYFLLGPVIFFYSRSLINPLFTLTRMDYLHFMPGLLYILYALIAFITDTFILDQFYFYADGRDKDLNSLYQFVGTAYMIVYLILCTRLYFSYQSRIYMEYSFAEAISYDWLKRFLLALVTILSARIIFLLIYPGWGDFGAKFWYYFIFSVLFYYIALTGLLNTIRLSISYHLPEESADQSKDEISTPLKDIEPLKASLNELMQNKLLYRNPLLSLTELSDEMGVHKKQISAIINRGFEMNFNDYVNSFRIEEVKNRLEQGGAEDFTILAIALDSGFNSKTTFNRAFKKYTDTTPQQFLKNMES